MITVHSHEVHERPPAFQSPLEATVVHLLTASGATIIRKTNCDEFGVGHASSMVAASKTYIRNFVFEGL